MKLLLSIRKQMGWTQTDLATYLGVKRGLVSMAEIGQRELPSAALVRASQLSRLLETETEKVDEKVAELLNELDHAASEALARWKKEAAIELKLTRELLAETEANYKEAVHLLKLLSHLPDLLKGQKNPAASVLTGLQEQKTLNKLKVNSPERQMNLKLKIAELEARIDLET
ncbi:helix-turn-helix domain-containing protein [Roseivirga sp. BDSF3-8]|uniref:helix-turn-helix domain-containing protein n=1 Tax=Roseivirga sp. BDSF3-8 TaxID=3241598 RepID=UPI003531B18F